jgi:protein-tyrosine phosphatase
VKTAQLIGLATSLLLFVAACGDGGTKGAADVNADAGPGVERRVPLQGQPNFRDLGGYETSGGGKVRRGMVRRGMVRRGMVYRSGELSKLTDADLAKLEELGIKTVVDFRSAAEVESRGVDRLPKGSRQLSLPIDSGDLVPVLMKALETGDTSKLPSNVLAEANRSIIRDAKSQYAALFKTLADPTALPLVFHCTHGKDRAGVAAAIVLMALGVPEASAREDYLRSNVFRKEQNDKELLHIRQGLAQKSGIPPADVDMGTLEELFWLEDSYFDAMLSEINSAHGSLDGYLKGGLGLGAGRLEVLRAQLTE